MKTGFPIYIFRHGMTKANAEHRYISFTDESLLASEKERLAEVFEQRTDEDAALKACRKIMISPMLRCRETAEILINCLDTEPAVEAVPDLRECDFGDFEYRTFDELREEPAYQRFILSLGESGFPGGETRSAFIQRCAVAFTRICWEIAEADGPESVTPAKAACGEETPVVVIAHGGTLMALLDTFSEPHGDYYDWQVKPGQGYRCELTFNEKGGVLVPVLHDPRLIA